MRMFEEALKETRASVTEDMEREYRELAETLKSESPRGRRKQIGFAVDGGTPPRHEVMAAD
jgi:transitional endoplasmic reticulum ATPase